jgi:hypothetical protein
MWIKSLAAVFLAFFAAVAVTGVIALFGPGSLDARTLPALLLFFPVWTATISLTFLARTGMRAVSWLLGVSVVGFGLQYLATSLHWVALPT